MVFLFLLIGAILGVALFEIEGLVPGALLGYLIHKDQVWRKTVGDLTQQIKALHDRIDVLSFNQKDSDDRESLATARATPPEIEFEIEDPEFLQKDQETVSGDEIPEPGPVRNQAEDQEFHPEAVGIIESIRMFVVQGNWLYVSGIAVLFVGLWLAIENEIIPLELSLGLISIVGGALIYTGSRLVKKRPYYGYVLEGGGIAILYLTIFASFRLYEVLSEPTATGLLMAVTLFGVLLGLAQDAQWVSAVSMLGGFFVPVLISNEGGSHVALFSYYAILNVGILGTAWYKPWRYLNLIGFICTFGVATVWGGLFYKPEFFASIEPFLILFFIIYLCIGVLFTLRHEGSIKNAVDGTLIFGLPVIVFALQASLVEPFEYGISISAAIMGMCYLFTAHGLRSRKSEKVGLLVESFDGVGIALVSLFVPFLFDTMWTGIGWAIEGAALVWLGMRQERLLVRISGYLLAIGASLVFIYGYADVSGWGFFPLSVALVFIACQVCAYANRLNSMEQFMEPVTMYTGLLFWLAGGTVELLDWLSYPREIHALVVYSGVTAFLCTLVGRAISWSRLSRASLFNVPVLVLLMTISVVDPHPFVYWGGGLAWLAAFVATYASLFLLEPQGTSRWLGWAHAIYLWVIAILGCVEGVAIMEEYTQPDSVWPLLGSLIVPVVLVALVSWVSRFPIWPFASFKKSYLRLALLPVIVGIALISIGGSFDNRGEGIYAGYIPILNPLDVLLLGFAMAAMYWYRRLREEGIELGHIIRRNVLVWSLVALLFIWMNATIARTVHHWADVPYNSAMWDSSLFQTALSICWTLLAVTTMAVVARLRIRTTWMVAAFLLAVVVLKLFVVDLSSLSVAPRIISFIGVGVLLLVIGYVAPVPPREDALEQVLDG